MAIYDILTYILAGCWVGCVCVATTLFCIKRTRDNNDFMLPLIPMIFFFIAIAVVEIIKLSKGG